MLSTLVYKPHVAKTYILQIVMLREGELTCHVPVS